MVDELAYQSYASGPKTGALQAYSNLLNRGQNNSIVMRSASREAARHAEFS
jgi:hypothetical protein